MLDPAQQGDDDEDDDCNRADQEDDTPGLAVQPGRQCDDANDGEQEAA
jgi:hypothetical protein